MARKLARHVQDTESADAATQIDAALDELAAHGLLSDVRAAASVLHRQSARFGERRLKQTLQSKGFAPELVASTLAKARSSEAERAREIWRRKFGSPPQSGAERAKQIRFLMGRGFSIDVISRVLREQGAGCADDGEAGSGPQGAPLGDHPDTGSTDGTPPDIGDLATA